MKRRTVAKEACEGGRVQVNGRTARAAQEVREGDVIQISLGQRLLEVEVVQVPAGQTRKEERAGLYRVLRREGPEEAVP
jgi:ribosomal 50S subunit-recycling heat shock protein